MKRMRGVTWGILLGLTLASSMLWAQAPPQDQQESPDQAQQQDQQYPDQTQPPAPAQDQQTSAAQESDQHDPPGRAARLQYMSGSVSIQPGGTGDWVAGAINRPLTNTDNIWTDKNSRSELNVGGGVLRMNSETSLTLTDISDNAVQVQLHQGTLNLHVHHLFGSEIYEVDTPNLAFTIQKGGDYRFDVDANGDATVVTVWKGEGDATGNGPSVTVRAHERARFNNGNSLTHQIAQAPGYDGFDDWCRVRDERQDHSVSARYVAPGTIGYEDLDNYGVWREIPPYGPVWVPSGVAAGWAPYTYGHWVWVAPWGWTWVDYEPWGFAPFHYGRWVYTGGFWGWAPGPYWGRPFYAPALVAWFGGSYWGGGFGFGFGGGIGWCALGWGEPFFPWYHVGRGYFRNVNIYNTHIVNINHFSNGYFHGGFGHSGFNGLRYANLRAPGGAIAVRHSTFVDSRSVHGNMVRVPQKEFANAALGNHMAIRPERVSRLGGNPGRAAMPSHSFSRPVVSRMQRPSGVQGGRGQMGRFNNRSLPAQGGGFAERSNPASGGHYVPRPSTGNSNLGRSSTTARNYVPRPPEGRSFGQASMSGSARGGLRPNGGVMAAPNNRLSRPSSSPEMRSAPRTPNGRSYSSPNRSVQPSSPRSGQGSDRGRGSNYVPRPTGPVRPSTYASNSYSERSASQSYSPRSYGSSSRSYGESSRYGASSPRYDSRPSYSSPSYRGYSAPSNRSYSAPSYRSYSAPSYRSYSAPSRGYSAPSYHGSSGYSGGGGRSYSGGGGHSYSGGGGHSYSGGGGHSSGGGHSGRR
jgi:ferric-dicitrate binding protein FerR (iron transport regulator)